MKCWHSILEKYPSLLHIILQSLGFLFLFTSYNPSSSLVTYQLKFQLLGYDNLGFYNLAAIQLFTALGNLISTYFITIYGFKLTHSVSTVCISQWVLISALPEEFQKKDILQDNIWVIYLILIISSSLCGLGMGVLWTVQGNYVSECANYRNRGFYFGLFWFTYMFSEAIGSIIAAVVLKMDDNWYFWIMALVAVLALPFFAILPKPNQDQSESSPSSRKSRVSNNANLMLIAQKSSRCLSLQFLAVKMKSVLKALKEKRMRRFLPQTAWVGISMAFIQGFLLIILMKSQKEEPDVKNRYSNGMFAMSFFGIGEMIGGVVIGLIVDRHSNQHGCLFNVLIMLAMLIVTMSYVINDNFQLWFAYLLTFIWGMQDGALNIHSFCILGFEFENSADSFAAFNMVQALVSFFFQIIQSFIPTDKANKYWVLTYVQVVGMVGIVFSLITLCFDYKITRAPGKIDGMVRNRDSLIEADKTHDTQETNGTNPQRDDTINAHPTFIFTDGLAHYNNDEIRHNNDNQEEEVKSDDDKRSSGSVGVPDVRSRRT